MDRGREDDQGDRDMANGNVTGGDKRGQTRRTWRPCGFRPMGQQQLWDEGVVNRRRSDPGNVRRLAQDMAEVKRRESTDLDCEEKETRWYAAKRGRSVRRYTRLTPHLVVSREDAGDPSSSGRLSGSGGDSNGRPQDEWTATLSCARGKDFVVKDSGLN